MRLNLPGSFTKTLLLLFCIIPLITKGQDKAMSCADLKTGFFHSYPKSTADHYFYTRDSSYQKEINTTNGDSTLWQISWPDECSYTLKYVSGTMDKAMIEFLKIHVLLFKVNAVTDNYFTFSAYVDKISDHVILADTMWSSERPNREGEERFAAVRTDVVPGKKYFNDTSKYAIVYVYRPGKLTHSLGDYLIYFNNFAICVAKNNTGYIFKVLKEGPLEVKSVLYKDVSAVNFDVKFGKKYYVKSMTHWTITSRLYNFKLEMKLMDPAEGQAEFDEVKQR